MLWGRCLPYVLLATLGGMAVVWADVPLEGTVVRVLDGDTVVLDSGERVRLLDMNAPEVAHDGAPAEPFGNAAMRGLVAMISGTHVTLETGPEERDQYGRVLAHLYTPDGRWVNGGMVAAGLAHVYTFADNAVYAAQMKALETQARAAKKGLWAMPRWQVRNAATCCGEEDVGQFILVQGRVLNGATIGPKGKDRRVYLNFGADQRTDFTVMIKGVDMRFFEIAGIEDIPAFYRGHTVLVRGFATPVNGTLIRITHPEQIDRVETR